MFGEEEEPTQPAVKVLEGIDRLDSAVFQVMGFVSVCWSKMHPEGVFDSDKAKVACDELIDWIRENYQPKAPGDWDELSDSEKLNIIHRLEVQTHTLLHTVAHQVGVEGHHG